MTVTELRSEVEAKFEEANEALENDDLSKAEEIKAEIQALQEKIKELEAELAEEEAEDPEEEKSEEVSAEEVKEERTESEESDEDSNDGTEEAQENIEIEGERKMTEVIEEVVLDNKEEVRSNFQNFIMNNEVRDLTTESGAVVIPEYIGTEVKDMTDEVVSLDKYVTIEPVSTPAGTKPVYKGDSAPILQTTQELQDNPKLGVQPLDEIDYKVATYRGYIPVSREAIEDGIGAEKLVKDILSEAVVNTRNAHILEIANGFEAVEADSLDKLKDIINVDLKPKFKKHMIMSQSVYNTIDKMKDGNGQYLLQNSISAASGKQLFGMEVVIFEDDLIGQDTMYVGNFAEAVVLFDRSQYQAQWTNYMQYGECLMVAIRHQVKELNADAVRKVTFTAPVEA
ncbi:phage major capsid protein [Salinicoccus halitifaciens]|uniref:HK97 family phage major capsid protein n=1 Tax=Salinicoccus halitifaciens TaxID=1073415 RepID=A0ABV2E7P0_9STAP|nr:phage major capsid protein [Salinicoccus halitifaciens]MCD2137175.1 phage major capsid protein [Salinicoccus halitifaciens]